MRRSSELCTTNTDSGTVKCPTRQEFQAKARAASRNAVDGAGTNCCRRDEQIGLDPRAAVSSSPPHSQVRPRPQQPLPTSRPSTSPIGWPRSSLEDNMDQTRPTPTADQLLDDCLKAPRRLVPLQCNRPTRHSLFSPRRSMAQPRPLKVLIAGAGIGGLAAAIALRQQGHVVEVRITPDRVWALPTSPAL